MATFTAHIRKSSDKQFYAVLVGKNSQDVFVQETIHKKGTVKKLLKKWFPDCEIIDETLKNK